MGIHLQCLGVSTAYYLFNHLVIVNQTLRLVGVCETAHTTHDT